MQEITDRIVYEADRARRQAEISSAVEASRLPDYPVPTGQGYADLRMVEIAPALLLYRADNGRILAELIEASADRGTGIGDITGREGAVETQAMLHHLLIDKARHPDGPIFDELAKQGRQTEPLLISSDGVVVNGNRRLAAMRALFAEDPDRYDGFGSVRAAVLDAATDPEQVEYIEAALQMAPDLKLAYGWINRRLKLREHARDLSRDRVVEAYRLGDEGEIDGELAELSLAEEYLEWSGAGRAYHHVADLETAFRDLLRQLESVEAPHLRGVWKLVGFAMIRARDETEANVGHYFPFANPAPPALKPWVPRALAEDRGLVERQDVGENRGLDPRAAKRLVPWLADPDNAIAVAGAAMALTDTLKADQQKHLGPARIQNGLRAARRQLETLPADMMTQDQLRTIRAEAAALVAYLDTWDEKDVRRGRAATDSTLGTLWKRLR